MILYEFLITSVLSLWYCAYTHISASIFYPDHASFLQMLLCFRNSFSVFLLLAFIIWDRIWLTYLTFHENKSSLCLSNISRACPLLHLIFFCHRDTRESTSKSKKSIFQTIVFYCLWRRFYTMYTDPALVVDKPEAAVYVLYRQRFYVLGIFSFLAFNQCAFLAYLLTYLAEYSNLLWNFVGHRWSSPQLGTHPVYSMLTFVLSSFQQKKWSATHCHPSSHRLFCGHSPSSHTFNHHLSLEPQLPSNISPLYPCWPNYKCRLWSFSNGARFAAVESLVRPWWKNASYHIGYHGEHFRWDSQLSYQSFDCLSSRKCTQPALLSSCSSIHSWTSGTNLLSCSTTYTSISRCRTADAGRWAERRFRIVSLQERP